MAPMRFLRCGKHVLEVGQRTLVMGVINVTPDSFSGDGLAGRPGAAVEQGLRMVEDGADILDVGGQSTRPGSEPISVEEELRRVMPVVEGLAARVGVPISIDTCTGEVAEAACEAGACIINDITGLGHEPRMPEIAAKAGAAVVIMHMKGTPKTMQQNPQYADVIGEITAYLRERAQLAMRAGVGEDRIVVDPGIGFGKTLEHNLEILRRLKEFKSLGFPLLVGTSRKSMIGAVLDLPADQRVEGTAATVALAIANGADIVRVHDVLQMARVAKMADAIVRGGRP